MISDEHDGRRFWGMILGVVVGLDACTDGLENESVVFTWDSDVSFGSEDGLSLGCFGHGLFDAFWVLGLVRVQHERLPSWVVAVEVFVRVISVFV